MSNLTKILNEHFERLEKKLLKLESRKAAKDELVIVLKSGYTNSDLQRLANEIKSGEKENIFAEIVKELNTHNDACDYYKSKSNGNLFECPEFDKDLLEAVSKI